MNPRRARMLRDLAPQRGKGSAQWDVVDTVERLGPCTWADIRVDTGRRNVPKVVRSLLRRGRLVAYDERTVDLPCEWTGHLRAGVRDPVHFSTRHRGWVRELSAWFAARRCREDGRACDEGPMLSVASWVPDPRRAPTEQCTWGWAIFDVLAGGGCVTCEPAPLVRRCSPCATS